jgi:hypothetical protein
MEGLFHGAYLRSCEEIGMIPDQHSKLEGIGGAGVNRVLFGSWLASIRHDPDLGQDIRTMVPVFYDVVRKQTKVWAILGVTTKPLAVSYETLPTVVEVRTPDGRLLKPRKVEVEFHEEYHRAAYFVAAEIYVTQLLNPTEFRRHCDRHCTYGAIVSSFK